MSSPPPTRADDEALLAMLDLRDGEGMSARQIAARVGKTRSAVCGAFARVKNEEVTECRCERPDNRDGAMGRGWWR